MFPPYLISFGILFGTTVGAGIFALPGLVRASGFIPFIFLSLGLSSAVIIAHFLYAKTLLEEKGPRHDLRGLAHKTLGSFWGKIGNLAIGGGLSLSLLVMLLLGANFLVTLFPALGRGAIPLFWLLVSVPLFLKIRGLGRVETALTACLILIVGVVFWNGLARQGEVALWGDNSFILFGPLLYALAGWTAIPTIARVLGKNKSKNILWGVLPGTLGAVALYFLFSFGMIREGAMLSADSVTGLSSIDQGLAGLLALFGLCAVWTTYIPVARELLASFSGDADSPNELGLVVVGLLPPLLIVLGATDIIGILSVAGGVFLSLQYVLLLSVSERALRLRGWKFYGVSALALLFLLAALAEIHYLVIRYL